MRWLIIWALLALAIVMWASRGDCVSCQRLACWSNANCELGCTCVINGTDAWGVCR